MCSYDIHDSFYKHTKLHLQLMLVGVAPPHEEPERETLYRGVPGQEEGSVAGTMYVELETETLQGEVTKHTEGVGVSTPT